MDGIKETITAEQAFALIMKGEQLCNRIITGTLSFEDIEVNMPVVLENCEIEHLKAGSVQFNKVVRFTKCHFQKCNFPFCYFPGGLEIVSCLFDSNLDFQCGGHTMSENTFRMSDSVIKGFVNFFDCFYEGPVVITNNKFEEGTNLLGNQNQAYSVSFHNTVIIEENKGELSINDEGGNEEAPEPTIFPIHLN